MIIVKSLLTTFVWDGGITSAGLTSAGLTSAEGFASVTNNLKQQQEFK